MVDTWGFLLKGLILGVSIAAPVGPIGMLCIRRTLESGFPVGLAGGLGTALADAFYGLIAALGLAVVASAFIDEHGLWLRLGGALFLIWLGVSTMLSKPAERAANVDGRGLLKAFASTFVLTLTNPATILSFAAIFAGLGLAELGTANRVDALILVAGVFLGSLLWWIILSGTVATIRRRVTPIVMLWINRVAGLVFLGFAAVILANAL